ncbi:hypothetical protein GCM10027169_24150 [Gordonia jinhuaensis]|uniref:Mce-associated membrane protein n=1 Tax=Gordonia jinhuaensis TaxID=1517702 RepID=A0A916TCY7_9ACTN|nr:hypothetical protein [Gordonia jinhuaensis]GGB40317.1 hypothetical protein GCM10011489_29860 [Gordonia jinhuaensis]
MTSTARARRPTRGGALAAGAIVMLAAAVAALVIAVVHSDHSQPRYSDERLTSTASRFAGLLLSPNRTDTGRDRAILSMSTGDFHDEFAQSADAYTEFVRIRGIERAGSVDGAAVDAHTAAGGRVLVTAQAGQASSATRDSGAAADGALRIRLVLTLESDGTAADLKVSEVELVT